jgi:hypothetical protein
MDSNTGDESIQSRLQVGLRVALKAKDTVTTSALRSALAAIANAEAVPVEHRSAAGSQHIAGGAAWLASAEAERKVLTREETGRIVEDEISDRQAAARQYEAAGRSERAARLRREAQAIRTVLGNR